MLRIQVLGKGMIPRNLGLAPRTEPFPADLRLIGIILATPGLSLKFIHPESGKPADLTRENFQAVYKKYHHKVYKGNAVPEATKPIIPSEIKQDSINPPEQHDKLEPHEEVIETGKPEQHETVIPTTPLEKKEDMPQNDKGNNNNNNKNQNFQNGKRK